MGQVKVVAILKNVWIYYEYEAFVIYQKGLISSDVANKGWEVRIWQFRLYCKVTSIVL